VAALHHDAARLLVAHYSCGRVGQVTCVYLFHELPADVRRAVAAEMLRVLRPGGLLVLVDSIQVWKRTCTV
jgi:SAM-dependent methyltransferase